MIDWTKISDKTFLHWSDYYYRVVAMQSDTSIHFSASYQSGSNFYIEQMAMRASSAWTSITFKHNVYPSISDISNVKPGASGRTIYLYY